MSDTVIKVENLSKSYLIRHQSGERYTALRDVLTNGVKSVASSVLRGARVPLGRGLRVGNATPPPATRHSPPTTEEFWALNDVSFEVKQGERVGIIGRNGAGKSTLLKILSRITEPTKGRVHIKGRVASLLEVGTGFHPELTGRENISLNGAILGMSREEIRRKFDEIVAFAEVEKFLDTPVKRYSSGMYVRLAFAVAAHLEPEILVVDEVLAVGDAAFQKKSLNKMGDVAKEGRTVLFVSHNLTAVQTLCSRAICLNNGQLLVSGEVNQVVASYLKEGVDELIEQRWDDPQTAPGNDETARMIYAGVSTKAGYNKNYLTVETPIDLVFEFTNFRSSNPLHLNLLVYNQDNICVFNTTSKQQCCPKGTVQGICHIPGHFLNDNVYTVWFLIHYQGADGVSVKNILTFEVHDVDRDLAWYGKWVGVVRPRLEWLIEPAISI